MRARVISSRPCLRDDSRAPAGPTGRALSRVRPRWYTAPDSTAVRLGAISPGASIPLRAGRLDPFAHFDRDSESGERSIHDDEDEVTRLSRSLATRLI